MDRDIAEVESPHVITVADQFAQAMHVALVEQPLAEPRKKFVDFSHQGRRKRRAGWFVRRSSHLCMPT
jgi:hypothetical protein